MQQKWAIKTQPWSNSVEPDIVPWKDFIWDCEAGKCTANSSLVVIRGQLRSNFLICPDIEPIDTPKKHGCEQQEGICSHDITQNSIFFYS